MNLSNLAVAMDNLMACVQVNPDESVTLKFLRCDETGAVFVIDSALAFGPIYADATYKYFGEAVPGTALTAAAWRVSRMTIATSRIEWADGNGNFDNVFASLAVVAELAFS